jgi:hypothetical protein
MFEGPDYPQGLNEEVFESWLENGRESKIGYNFMLIFWDVFDQKLQPVYVETREEIQQYELYPEAKGSEALIAAYDLYSEGRISLNNTKLS